MIKDDGFVQLEFCFEEEKIEKPNKKTKRKSEKIDYETRNRELMIKYKYDTISRDELNELHDNLEKLIYQVIHKNYVSENFYDVYLEIWKKIIKYKDKWDENRKNNVSTWIAKVAFNVIQTIRKKSIVHRSRYVSLMDTKVTNKKGEEMEVDYEKIISDEKDDIGMRRKMIYDVIKLCKFSKEELAVVKLYLEDDCDKLIIQNENREYKRHFSTVSFIKSKLNLTNKKYNDIMKSIGEKYVRAREDSYDGTYNGDMYWFL
jgi:hypothetical protein